MRIMVATDVSIIAYDNKYYFAHQVSAILKRYYNSFGKLVVCSRVKVVDSIPDSCEEITDIIESVINISSLGGVFLGKYNKEIKETVERCELVICRCPGIIAYKAADEARKMKKPYFTESMGCAWDAYWNHGMVGKAIAPYMFYKMKSVVYNADYALYVTRQFLQKRYPCKNESVSASNVLLSSVEDSILEERFNKIECMDKSNITLMTVAAVDVKYKGQEYVIKAIPELNKLGINVKYLLVGDGDREYLKSISKKLGVEKQVVFLGRLTLEDVFKNIKNADIYIQPSLQEGLPRSVIEAMSMGCPCIGAKTAGIPELIDSNRIFKRKSFKDIVRCITNILNSDLKNIAQKDFEESKKYYPNVLDDIRNSYYNKILVEFSNNRVHGK